MAEMNPEQLAFRQHVENVKETSDTSDEEGAERPVSPHVDDLSSSLKIDFNQFLLKGVEYFKAPPVESDSDSVSETEMEATSDCSDSDSESETETKESSSDSDDYLKVEKKKPDAKAKAIFQDFDKRTNQKLKFGTKEGEEADIFKCKNFEDMAKIMDDVEHAELQPGWLKRTIIKIGSSESIEERDRVYLRFELYDDLDKLELAKQRVRFEVGKHSVIPALDIGVLGMGQGSHIVLLATHEAGYGKLGIPEFVGPEAKIVLNAFILEVKKYETIKDRKLSFWELSATEQGLCEFDEAYNAVMDLKAVGNGKTTRKKFREAIKYYKEAGTMAENLNCTSDEQLGKKHQLLNHLESNIAQCYLHLNCFKKAKIWAQRAVDQPIPKNDKIKSYVRLGKALHKLGDVQEAYDAVKNVEHLSSYTVSEMLSTMMKDLKILRDEERALARKFMFSEADLD